MSDDHRALIESVRAEHLQHVPMTPQGTDSWCYRCRLRWPCDAVRLAEALEAALERLVGWRTEFKHRSTVVERERDAALARAEILIAAITWALDGCPFCRMGQCRADAHNWLTDALAEARERQP